MTGLPVILGDHRSPHATYIQAAETGKCMPATETAQCVPKQRLAPRLIVEVRASVRGANNDTAICNARFKLDVRLARWLLMAHDRIGEDKLPLTHEFLSIMLPVRPGVTEALTALREQGLISCRRGLITVEDRRGMEHKAGTTYGVPEAEYRRLIG
jgi:hypothetical protein